MASRNRKGPVPVDHITQSIAFIRGQRVLLDRRLAEIYGVTTGQLNEAIKRNQRGFQKISCSS